LAKTADFFSKQETAGKGSSSDRDRNAKLWKEVWTIQAPNEMKVVLWRMMHDYLPIGHQLMVRHIPADGHCFFCGSLEQVEHLFLFCPFARAMWDAVKEHFQVRLHRKELCHMKQWISGFLNRESNTNAMVLAVTCWHI
jgi:hypothetical protein